MIAYADSSDCLRASILQYLGDAAWQPSCVSCGNCRPDSIDSYERDLVRKIMAGIARAGERYGRTRIVAMLTGETRDLPPALASLSTTGLLRGESSDDLRRWIDTAVAAGLIAESKDKYRTLSLTDRGRDAMSGRLSEFALRRPPRRFGVRAGPVSDELRLDRRAMLALSRHHRFR